MLIAVLLTSGSPSPDDGEPMTRALLSYADSDWLDELREDAGPNGWGLTYAWDAYQDGTVNPADTTYAITTALVLSAFLDAGQEPPAGIAEHWAGLFADGFYPYSDQPADAIFTPNVSAMMAAVMYRLGYTEQADEAIERLVTSWPWTYSERTERPNDKLHLAYTYWGLEVYRQAGGSVPIPWTPADAVAHMDRTHDLSVWPTAAVAVRNAYARCFARIAPLPVPLPESKRDAAHAHWPCYPTL